MSRKLLAIVTDPLEDEGPIEELRRAPQGEGVEVRVVVPAVEENAFRHALGDVDEPARRAAEILRASIEALHRHGVPVSGGVGDADPVLAAQDALRVAPADEVLIFEHAADQARWFESNLFERAREELRQPLRMVVLDGKDGHASVVGVERAAGSEAAAREGEVADTAYFPGLSPADLGGMVVGIVGTIVAIVLAAAGSNPSEGWGAVAVGIAIAIALINMSHVIGLTLFESVRYRGGFARFFSMLSLVGTPTAIIANLLILLFT